jgi:hypothetical protein
MSVSSYYLHNNSLIVPIHSRLTKKKLINRSTEKLPKVEALHSPPVTSLKSKSISLIKKPKSLHQFSTSSIDSFFDIDTKLLNPPELKEMLISIIQQELSSLKIIQERCSIMSSMIKTIEKSSFFSEKDLDELMQLIENMGKTVLNTSETEIELGTKHRLYEKLSIEHSSFKANFSSIQKRLHQTEKDCKDLRDKVKGLQEENARLLKIIDGEKQKNTDICIRNQNLEESLWVMSSNANNPTHDSINKLKIAINSLLRDTFGYRKEIQIA